MKLLGRPYLLRGLIVAGVLALSIPARAATVSITKTAGGAPVTSGTAYLFTSSGSYLNTSVVLGAAGQVSFGFTPGQSYKLRIDRLGVQFWSPVFDGATPPAEIVFPHSDRVVTVQTVYGTMQSPLTGVPVYVFGGSSGTTYVSLNQTTNAAGQVTFNLPDTFNYRYRADYRSVQTFSSLGAGTTDAVSISTGSIRVRFTAGLTNPQGVSVYAFTAGGSYLSLNGLTNGDGEVLFQQFPIAGAYKFRADYQGSQYWSAPLGAIASGEETPADVSVPTEDIQFTMKAAAGGPVLSSGTVYLFTSAGAYLNRSQAVGPGGGVAFTGLTAGTYKFRYDVLGTQTFSANVTVPGSSSFSEFVVPHSNRVVSVRTVYGQTGEPLTSGTVYAYTGTGTYLNLSAAPDAAGNVSFFLPDSLSAKYRADYRSKQTWSAASADTNVQVEIPVSSVRVVFPSSELLEPVTFYAYTDAGSYLNLSGQGVSGEYVFAGLPSDQLYRFRADYLAFEYWVAPGVTLVPGIETTLTFSVDSETAEFAVRSSPGGEPLQAGVVYLFSGDGQFLNQSRAVGGTGEVSFFGLTTGSYKFRYDAFGTQTFSPEANVPGIGSFTEFVVPFSERTVQVAITDGASQTPLADAPVYVFTASGTYLNASRTTEANGQAAFFLPDSLNAKYRVDYRSVQTFSAATQSAQVPVQIPVADIRARFVAGSNTPAGVGVYLFAASGSYLNLTGQTNASGETVFSDLPVAGTFKLRADHLGSQYWSEDIENLTGGEERTVQIGLVSETAAFTMRGAAGGEPLGFGSVYLFTGSGTYLGQSRTVGPDGTVSFEGLTPGNYKFRYDAYSAQTFSLQVTVPGLSSFTEFVVPFGSRSVLVQRDFGSSQVPLSGVPVYAFNAAGSYLGLTEISPFSGEVTFRLPQVVSAKYRGDYLGYQFWSPAGTGSETVSIPTGYYLIRFKDGSAYQSVPVHAYTSAGQYIGYSGTLNGADGYIFTLPAGVEYQFRIDYSGQHYVSTPEATFLGDTVPIEIALNQGGNEPPVADAGPDTIALVMAPLQLDGGNSYDPDESPSSSLTYRWSIVSSPAGAQATLASLTSGQPMITPDVSGLWVFQLIVNDGLDDSAPDEVAVSVDVNQPPVAVINAPGRMLAGTTVTMSGADSYDPDELPEDYLAYAWVILERPIGSNSELESSTAARNSFVADIAGLYRVRLIVYDNLDYSLPVEAEILAIEPGITLSSPLEGQVYSTGTVTVSGEAISHLPIGEVELIVDNGSPIDILTYYDYSVSFSHVLTLAGGSHTIEVRAIDSSLTTRSVTRHIIVDTTAPLLQIASPQEGQTFPAGNITVSGTATDSGVGLASVTVNGQNATVGSDGAFTATVSASSSGPYPVSVVATDNGGRTTTLTVTVQIEAEAAAPVVELSSPVNGYITDEPVIVVSGHVLTTSPLAGLSVNGIAVTPVPADGEFSTAVTLLPGTNNVLVVARDSNQREGEVSITVLLDATAPAIQIQTPVAGSVYLDSSQIAYSGSVTDDTGIASFTINGQTVPFSGTVFSGYAPTSEGPGTIVFTAVDLWGRSSSRIVEIAVDTEVPYLEIDDAPGPILTPARTYPVTGIAADENGIASVAVNGSIAALVNGRFGADAVLEPGTNTVVVEVTDNAGRTASGSLEVVYDNVPPEIAVAPYPAVTMEAGIELTGSVTDLFGVHSAQLNGQPLTLGSGGAFGLQLTLLEGLNEYVLSAEDNAGNVSSETVRVTRDNSSPLLLSLVPANGASGVGPDTLVTAVFSEPLDPGTVIPDAIVLRDATGSKPFSMAVSADGSVVAIKPSGSFPPDTTVIVELGLNASYRLKDRVGHEFEGVRSAFRTGSPDYFLSGQVLGDDGLPLPGIQVELRETGLKAPTDEYGMFEFVNPPPGNHLLYIDARSAESGSKRFEIRGQRVLVARGQTLDLYPPIFMTAMAPETATYARAGGPSPIDFNGAFDTSARGSFRLETAAGSLTFPDGTRDGIIQAARMPVSNLPFEGVSGDAPPIFAFDLQPSGTVLDPPASITLPNDRGLPVGTIIDLFSYSNETGRKEFIGKGEVVATELDDDGKPIATEIRSIDAKVEHFSMIMGSASETLRPARVEVEVVDTQGAPVPGVAVNLSQGMGPVAVVGDTTDSSGIASFTASIYGLVLDDGLFYQIDMEASNLWVEFPVSRGRGRRPALIIQSRMVTILDSTLVHNRFRFVVDSVRIAGSAQFYNPVRCTQEQMEGLTSEELSPSELCIARGYDSAACSGAFTSNSGLAQYAKALKGDLCTVVNIPATDSTPYEYEIPQPGEPLPQIGFPYAAPVLKEFPWVSVRGKMLEYRTNFTGSDYDFATNTPSAAASRVPQLIGDIPAPGAMPVPVSAEGTPRAYWTRDDRDGPEPVPGEALNPETLLSSMPLPLAKAQSGWMRNISVGDIFCNTNVLIFGQHMDASEFSDSPEPLRWDPKPIFILNNRFSPELCAQGDGPSYVMQEGVNPAIGVSGGSTSLFTVEPSGMIRFNLVTATRPTNSALGCLASMTLLGGKSEEEAFAYCSDPEKFGGRLPADVSREMFGLRLAPGRRLRAVVHHIPSGYIGFQEGVMPATTAGSAGQTGSTGIRELKFLRDFGREIRVMPPLVELSGRRVRKDLNGLPLEQTIPRNGAVMTDDDRFDVDTAVRANYGYRHFCGIDPAYAERNKISGTLTGKMKVEEVVSGQLPAGATMPQLADVLYGSTLCRSGLNGAPDLLWRLERTELVPSLPSSSSASVAPGKKPEKLFIDSDENGASDIGTALAVTAKSGAQSFLAATFDATQQSYFDLLKEAGLVARTRAGNSAVKFYEAPVPRGGVSPDYPDANPQVPEFVGLDDDEDPEDQYLFIYGGPLNDPYQKPVEAAVLLTDPVWKAMPLLDSREAAIWGVNAKIDEINQLDPSPGNSGGNDPYTRTNVNGQSRRYLGSLGEGVEILFSKAEFPEDAPGGFEMVLEEVYDFNADAAEELSRKHHLYEEFRDHVRWLGMEMPDKPIVATADQCRGGIDLSSLNTAFHQYYLTGPLHRYYLPTDIKDDGTVRIPLQSPGGPTKFMIDRFPLSVELRQFLSQYTASVRFYYTLAGSTQEIDVFRWQMKSAVDRIEWPVLNRILNDDGGSQTTSSMLKIWLDPDDPQNPRSTEKIPIATITVLDSLGDEGLFERTVTFDGLTHDPVEISIDDLGPLPDTAKIRVDLKVYYTDPVSREDYEVKEVHTGKAQVQTYKEQGFQLGHTFVKGVDVSNGSLNLQRTDFSVKRRGPGLELTRSYSSKGMQEGPFGPGWSWNHGGSLMESKEFTSDGQVQGGDYVSISNADGTSAHFVRDAASGKWGGVNGFHGHLERGTPAEPFLKSYEFAAATAAYPYDPEPQLHGRAYVYTTKEGWRYVYAESVFLRPEGCKSDANAFPFLSGRPNLVSVSDPDGNQLRYVYTVKRPDPSTPEHEDPEPEWLLQSVEHYNASGAADGKIELTWNAYRSALTQRNAWRVKTAVTSGVEPAISMNYEYWDDEGTVGPADQRTWQRQSSSLRTATRQGVPSRAESYDYRQIFKESLPPDYENPSRFSELALMRLWRLSAVTDAEGRRTSYGYDIDACGLNGRPDGNLARLMGLDFVTEVTEPEGAVTSFRYDGPDFRFPLCRSAWTRVTDPLQRPTDYFQNGWGGTFAVRAPEALSAGPGGSESDSRPLTQKTWSGVPNPDYVLADFFHPEGLEADDLPPGVPAAPCGGVSERDRLVCSETDALGRTTRFRYDVRGNLLERKDPDGLTETFAYNPETGSGSCDLGTPLWPIQKVCRQTDRAGRVTKFGYDDKGHLLRTQKDNPGSGLVATIHVYDTEYIDPGLELPGAGEPYTGDLLATTDPNGHVTEYADYHVSGQPGKVTDPEGRETLLTYDGRGRLVSSADGEGTVTAYTWNGLDQLTETSVTGLNGATGEEETFTQQTVWDRTGHKLCETERDSSAAADDGGTCAAGGASGTGRHTRWTYDGLYRVTETNRPLGWTVRYGYDLASRKTQETDPRGTVTRFDYDGLDRLVSVRRAFGTAAEAVVRYTYDLAGNKRTETDPRQNATEWSYDELNRVVSVSYPDGGGTSYTYTATGAVETETVKLTATENRVTTNTYDAFDRLVSSEVPGQGTVALTYDKAGNLLSRTNRRGQAETRTYFDNNLLKTVTTHDGRLSEYSYDNANRLVRTTLKALGSVPGVFDRVTEQAYDALSRVTKTTVSGSSGATAGADAGNGARSRTVAYDGSGNEVSSTDFRGNVTGREFDALGRLVRETLPASAAGAEVRTFTYDLSGNLLTETDFLGRTTSHTYDALSRRLATTDRAGNTVSWTYDRSGNTVSFTDARSNTTQTSYDSMNRPVTVTGALGFAVSTAGYDLAGRVSFRRDGEGRTAVYAYDVLDRLVRETAASGAVTAYTVDNDGNRLSASYGGGRSQHWTYDSEGRVLTARSGGLPDTSYTYDAAGNLASFTDADGRTTSMRYTLPGKPWRQQLADGAVRRYEYDADGNVTKETDANNKVTQHTYDALSRRITTTLPGAAAGDDVSTIDYAYDRNGNLVSTTEHVANTPDPDRTVAYTYDHLDRPLTKTDGDGNLSVAVYDGAGNRTALTMAGRTTSYVFDELNRVASVSHGGSPVAGYTWNRASQPVQIARANGTSTVYSYDGAGRLASLGHDLGGNKIAGFEYSYTSGDAMDLVSRLKEYRPAGSVETTDYGYDSSARLTQWQVSGASPYTTTLGLGHTGDRLSETTTGTGAKTRSYSYNSRHQLTGLDDSLSGQLVYQWDSEGRLLSKGAPLSPSPKTFTWDSRDRLTAVEEAFSTLGEYRYEETGLKTESFWPALAAAQQVRKYQWVGRELLAVRKADNSVVSRIVRGVDREILGHETGGNSFVNVHSDRLGSVVAETGPDPDDERPSGGNGPQVAPLTHSRVYDPFGNTRSETGASEMPLGYTGQEMDPVTGLVQMKARWYDPDAGIFISEDPRAYSPADPFSLHEYLYANADPVNWTDPTGETSIREVVANYAINTDSSVGKAAAITAYVVSDALTFGFLGRQDERQEKFDRGQLTETEFNRSTAIDAGITAATAVATAAVGGAAATEAVAGRAALTTAEAAVVGAKVGFAAGTTAATGQLAEGTAETIASHGKSGHIPTAGEYAATVAVSTVAGAAISAGTNAIASRTNAANAENQAGNTAKRAVESPKQAVSLAAPEPVAKTNTAASGDQARAAQGVTKGLQQLTKPSNTAVAPYWPANRGFAGKPESVTLQPGTAVDRYGPASGSFVSPQGTPFEMRGLPSGLQQSAPLNTYEVVKPLNVQSGKATPAFNSLGGGIQHELPAPVGDLVEMGYLKKVPNQ